MLAFSSPLFDISPIRFVDLREAIKNIPGGFYTFENPNQVKKC
jgi:hypothetical protein